MAMFKEGDVVEMVNPGGVIEYKELVGKPLIVKRAPYFAADLTFFNNAADTEACYSWRLAPYSIELENK